MTAAEPRQTTAEDIYQATILDRARRPRHQRRLEAGAVEAEERNPLCGDRVSVQLNFGDDGRVSAIGYRARACAICIAATDLMAEIVPGLSPDVISEVAGAFEKALRRGEAIPADSIMGPLAVFAPLETTPSRIQCALLGWQAAVTAATQPH